MAVRSRQKEKIKIMLHHQTVGNTELEEAIKRDTPKKNSRKRHFQRQTLVNDIKIIVLFGATSKVR